MSSNVAGSSYKADCKGLAQVLSTQENDWQQMSSFPAQGVGPAHVFHAEAHIKAQTGGRVVAGNQEFGYSKILFRPDDLQQDTTITLEWAPYPTVEEIVSHFRFGPHGTVFNAPVRLEIHYETAILDEITEDKLHLLYYKEEADAWQRVPALIMGERQKIVTHISHFSRYALGLE